MSHTSKPKSGMVTACSKIHEYGNCHSNLPIPTFPKLQPSGRQDKKVALIFD